MSDRYVLDASAVLCLLKGEPGTDIVARALPMAIIGAVNVSEVVAKLADAGGSEARIARALGALRLDVVPFDVEQAEIAGLLRVATKTFGLSLGDRACLALARHPGATALTTDRAWAELPSELGPCDKGRPMTFSLAFSSRSCRSVEADPLRPTLGEDKDRATCRRSFAMDSP